MAADRQARLASYEADIAGLADSREGLLGEVEDQLTATRREGCRQGRQAGDRLFV